MTKSSKPFLTYTQQFERLEQKGISCSSKEEQTIIIRKGYFNLINGYKKPFVSSKDATGDHLYFRGTSVYKLYQVMKFDKRISSLLLKNVTHVEEEIRAISAHQFAKINHPLGLSWNSKKAYDSKVSEAARKTLIIKIKKEIKDAEKSNNEYVKHYKIKDSILPLWVMIKVIRFTTLISLIKISKKELRVFISELYNIEYNEKTNDFRILFASLQWMRKVRNSCAHNERILFLKDDDKVAKTKFHISLAKSYTHPKRTKQLVDLLIYLKYFNRKIEYTNLINRVLEAMDKIKDIVGEQPFERIRAGMGIKNIEHLTILKKERKTIDFFVIK